MSEKKEIIIDVLIQLLKFYKYFNMVIRNHFSIYRFSSTRRIPKPKYIIKNDRLPKLRGFVNLNFFLSKKERIEGMLENPTLTLPFGKAFGKGEGNFNLLMA